MAATVLIPAMRRAMDSQDGLTVIDDDISSEISGVEDRVAGDGYERYAREENQEDRECRERVEEEQARGCWDPPLVNRCSRDAGAAANQQCFNKPDVLLLADSWTGQTSDTFHDRLRRERIKLLQIPKRTTAELQPLDVNFNRQYKKIIKRICCEMILNLHE